MNVEIYHANASDFQSAQAFTPRNYTFVGLVDAPVESWESALEYAFQATQHVNGNWVDHTHVTTSSYTRRMVRSTSVGDIMVVEDRPYGVEVFGFAEIEWEVTS